jgi:hypothetical protein
VRGDGDIGVDLMLVSDNPHEIQEGIAEQVRIIPIKLPDKLCRELLTINS